MIVSEGEEDEMKDEEEVVIFGKVDDERSEEGDDIDEEDEIDEEEEEEILEKEDVKEDYFIKECGMLVLFGLFVVEKRKFIYFLICICLIGFF